jgi:hypothetical protein
MNTIIKSGGMIQVIMILMILIVEIFDFICKEYDSNHEDNDECDYPEEEDSYERGESDEDEENF